MRSKKGKILIISKNFPPSLGGMEHLAWKLYQQLEPHYQCDIIAPDGAEQFVNTANTNIFTCPLKPLPYFLFTAYRKALKLASNTQYDLCIGCSGIVAPITNALAKQKGIPSVILVHGLDIIAQNFIYQRYFVPRICNSNLIIANSANTAKLTRKKCTNSNLQVINPGVDAVTDLAPANNQFRETFKLGNKPILLSVGRIIPRKGLAEFIRYCLPEITKNHPNVIYCIAGEAPRHAINKTGDALSAIHESIASTGLHDNILITGKLSDELLHSAYSESSLFIFPVLESENDIEGFGMVAIEAAARGLPTAAFASGGIPDAVSPQSGVLVPTGNYQQLSQFVVNYIDSQYKEITPDSCQQHASKYSWENYGRKFRHEIDEIIV